VGEGCCVRRKSRCIPQSWVEKDDQELKEGTCWKSDLWVSRRAEVVPKIGKASELFAADKLCVLISAIPKQVSSE
jgi:hypothetical protein